MKIPTLLGLALLGITTAAALTFYFYQQNIDNFNQALLAPNNIKVINLTDTQATITWQTNKKVKGSISFGSEEKLDQTEFDERDQDKAEERLSHFVTIKNLKPNKQYFFKIKNSKYNYPKDNLTLKTAATPTDNPNPLLNQSLQGGVVTSDLKPADDTLIFLETPGASVLGTYTNAGNFIIPLKQLYSLDQTSFFNLKENTESNLVVTKGDLESKIQIIIPLRNSPLPTISLGQNLDLRQILASSSAKQNITLTPNKFDLNTDGKVNTLDLGILRQNLNKALKNPRYDFNSDNKIDNTDLDLLRQEIK